MMLHLDADIARRSVAAVARMYHRESLAADLASKGNLPKSRADGCELEYQQVEYAFQRLIEPNIDQALRKTVQPRKWL